MHVFLSKSFCTLVRFLLELKYGLLLLVLSLFPFRTSCMSYWNPDDTSARAARIARRAMADPPQNAPPGDAGAQAAQSHVQAADVAAASQLLQSVGISVGAARPERPERPANLGLKLPVFKGEPDHTGRVSQYAVQDFLDRVQAYFASNAGQYADDSLKLLSLLNCFPYGTPSAVWWASIKSSCATLADFDLAFKKKYGFDKRDAHYVLEKFSNFRQRDNDNVVTYHTHFTSLVTEMTLLLEPEDVPSEATQRARFINGLRAEVKSLVMRTVTRHPDLTLYDVMQEAIMEERQLPRRPRPVRPAVNAMNASASTPTRCGFCGATEHVWDTCPRIAAKKRNGTWQDRPRQSKQ